MKTSEGQIHVVREGLAAEVAGLDLSSPPDGVAAEVEAWLAAHPVLVVRGQDVTDEQLSAFASLFGPLTPMGRANQDSRMKDGVIFDVSNVDAQDAIVAGDTRRRLAIESARLWHVDSSYNPTPDSLSILYARKVTSTGGETEFADLRAAYDALAPDVRARLSNCVGLHSRAATVQRAGFGDRIDPQLVAPSAAHRMVRRNPLSGRDALYIASHMCGVQDMEAAAFEDLLEELTAFASQPRFVYSHRWREGDVVIWDNRAVMHRGRPYDADKEVRDIRQIRITERDYQPLPITGAA